MSTFVKTEKQLVKNISSFYSSIYSKKYSMESRNLLKNGKVLIFYLVDDTWYFCPSRFAGYKNNTVKEHISPDSHRHGTRTEDKLKKFTNEIIYGDDGYELLTKRYKALCVELGVSPKAYGNERKFRLFQSNLDDFIFSLSGKNSLLTPEDHAKRIARTFQSTLNGSGKIRLKKNKIKTSSMTKDDIESLVLSLMKSQNYICKLTGLKIIENGDKDFFPSLDRIDSNGGYEIENLQLVCRFANKWKSDQENDKFKNLIKFIKNS